MLDNAKTKIFGNKKLLATFGVLILILIIATVGYSFGYRFKNNFLIGKVGFVSMEIPTVNTSIYIDESKKITTTIDNELVKVTLSPQMHRIIVARDGSYPWKKELEIPSGGVLELTPRFVTMNTVGEIITINDPEYYKIRNKVIADVLPTKEKPLASSDGKVSLWLDDNAIVTQIGSTTEKVIQPDTIIRNVYFYKNGSDGIMFSNSNSVFVIDTDKTGGQNFMPIYRGQKPSFIRADESSIYILDGTSLMQVLI